MNDATPDKDEIAVPPMTVVPLRMCRDETGFSPQGTEIEKTTAVADTLISFLQRNHIGIELADDVDDTRWIKLAVDADAFVDVIGGNSRAWDVAVQLDRSGCFPPKCCGERLRQRRRDIQRQFVKGQFVNRNRLMNKTFKTMRQPAGSSSWPSACE